MEKIYLRDVLGLLWAARFFIFFSTAATLLIAIWLLVVTPPQYEASVTLVPTQANQYPSQNGSSGASNLVGSLAGQFLGVANDKDAQSTAQFLELMKSPFVVNSIDRRYHILPHIFSSQWDAQEKQWIRPSGPITDIKYAFKAVLHRPQWAPPGPYEASQYLALKTTVDIPPQSSMVHLSLRDRDPTYAAFLLNALYQATDGLLRERAKQRSDEHIAYIQRQLASTGYTETRQSLGTLLTVELGQQLLINSNAPYVLEKLTPITQSPNPVSPNIMVYLAGGCFLGIALGFVLSLIDRKFGLGGILKGQWLTSLAPYAHRFLGRDF